MASILQQAKNARVRVLTTIDQSSKTLHMETTAPSDDIAALSHRWEGRGDANEWTVRCDGGKEVYQCRLYDDEADNLQVIMNDGNPKLWLDYIGINQNNEKDKVAQVAIMGEIYLFCTTIPVGFRLNPYLLPSSDYLERAWIIQERSFGKCKILWSRMSIVSDIPFCRRILHELFIVDPLFDTFSCILESGQYIYTQYLYYREEEIQKAAKRYPEASSLILKLIEMCQTLAPFVEFVQLCIDIRNLIKFCHYPDASIYQQNMFKLSASIPKDILYGVWGVPMAMKSLKLPYDDPKTAWSMVKAAYPAANWAQVPDPRDVIFDIRELIPSVESVIHEILECATGTVICGTRNTKEIQFPKEFSTDENFQIMEGDIDAVLAYNDWCVLILDKGIITGSAFKNLVVRSDCHEHVLLKIIERFLDDVKFKVSGPSETHWKGRYEMVKLLYKEFDAPPSGEQGGHRADIGLIGYQDPRE